MKKTTILAIMQQQQNTEKKSTRAKFVGVVANLVAKHLDDNTEYYGLARTYNDDREIINLGCAMEIIIANVLGAKADCVKSSRVYRIYKDRDYNKFQQLVKDIYDANVNGETYEIKFATTDAPAHKQNLDQQVDKYVIATYSAKDGGQVFVFTDKKDITLDNQGRAIANQRAKFLNKELTQRVFGA